MILASSQQLPVRYAASLFYFFLPQPSLESEVEMQEFVLSIHKKVEERKTSSINARDCIDSYRSSKALQDTPFVGARLRERTLAFLGTVAGPKVLFSSCFLRIRRSQKSAL